MVIHVFPASAVRSTLIVSAAPPGCCQLTSNQPCWESIKLMYLGNAAWIVACCQVCPPSAVCKIRVVAALVCSVAIQAREVLKKSALLCCVSLVWGGET